MNLTSASDQRHAKRKNLFQMCLLIGGSIWIFTDFPKCARSDKNGNLILAIQVTSFFYDSVYHLFRF